MPYLRTFLALPLLVAAGAGLTACGSTSSSANPRATTTAATPTPAVARSMTVTSTDNAFSPTAVTVKAGKVKVTLVNKGAIEHELVVLRSDADPASLKANAKGRVSEAASVGEVSETAAGKTKSTTLTLKPGRYVYVCNIPGHYESGMRGELTVQ